MAPNNSTRAKSYTVELRIISEELYPALTTFSTKASPMKNYECNKVVALEYQCHGCGAGRGNFHHSGCDMDDCPKCRG